MKDCLKAFIFCIFALLFPTGCEKKEKPRLGNNDSTSIQDTAAVKKPEFLKRLASTKKLFTLADSMKIDSLARHKALKNWEFIDSLLVMAYYKPIAIVLRTASGIDLIVLINDSPTNSYDLDYCEMIINPDGQEGGYSYTLAQGLLANKVWKGGTQYFFNADGKKFPASRKIVDLKVRYRIKGEEKVQETDAGYFFNK